MASKMNEQGNRTLMDKVADFLNHPTKTSPVTTLGISGLAATIIVDAKTTAQFMSAGGTVNELNHPVSYLTDHLGVVPGLAVNFGLEMAVMAALLKATEHKASLPGKAARITTLAGTGFLAVNHMAAGMLNAAHYQNNQILYGSGIFHSYAQHVIVPSLNAINYAYHLASSVAQRIF